MALLRFLRAWCVGRVPRAWIGIVVADDAVEAEPELAKRAFEDRRDVLWGFRVGRKE